MSNNRKAILCFEGASGIGKTTISQLFRDEYNIVAEVNQLYSRAANDSDFWYYEKQVTRFQLCEKSDVKSILDGDVFQPIWYNWIYNYPSEFLPKKEVHGFYREMIKSKRIAFPDLYIVFQIDTRRLRERKEKDTKRKRRNFEKHLEYIEPQLRYFNYLSKNTEIEVEFIENFEIEKTKEKVNSLIRNINRKEKNELLIFEKIVEWIKTN